MAKQQDDAEQLRALLDGIKTDAAAYFDKAKEALPDIQSPRWRFEHGGHSRASGRDEYWAELPDEIHSEAKRLEHRLISVMGQVARAVRNALLVSEADQRT